MFSELNDALASADPATAMYFGAALCLLAVFGTQLFGKLLDVFFDVIYWLFRKLSAYIKQRRNK